MVKEYNTITFVNHPSSYLVAGFTHEFHKDKAKGGAIKFNPYRSTIIDYDIFHTNFALYIQERLKGDNLAEARKIYNESVLEKSAFYWEEDRNIIDQVHHIISEGKSAGCFLEDLRFVILHHEFVDFPMSLMGAQ